MGLGNTDKIIGEVKHLYGGFKMKTKNEGSLTKIVSNKNLKIISKVYWVIIFS